MKNLWRPQAYSMPTCQTNRPGTYHSWVFVNSGAMLTGAQHGTRKASFKWRYRGRRQLKRPLTSFLYVFYEDLIQNLIKALWKPNEK